MAFFRRALKPALRFHAELLSEKFRRDFIEWVGGELDAQPVGFVPGFIPAQCEAGGQRELGHVVQVRPNHFDRQINFSDGHGVLRRDELHESPISLR